MVTVVMTIFRLELTRHLWRLIHELNPYISHEGTRWNRSTFPPYRDVGSADHAGAIIGRPTGT